MALAKLAAARKKLGLKSGALQIVFVTIDPERDTQKQLREYTSQFDATIVSIRENQQELHALAAAFRVYFSQNPGAATVDHSDLIYLVDCGGIARIAETARSTADDISRDVDLMARSPSCIFKTL